jgi:hypothetical protein
MAIKDIYNSVGNEVKKVAGSISDYVSPVHYVASAQPTQYQLKDRGVQISENDLNAVRPLIYGEISNRTPDKQALEAHVILNTALNRLREYSARGQNKTLADVISMPNQYQAYGGKQYQTYSNPVNTLDMAKKKQVDAIVDDIHRQVQSGQYPDNTEGAYYYVHDPKTGAITYDNRKQLFAK